MKKSHLMCAFCACVFTVVMFASSVQAATISIVPSSQTINVSETTAADLVISGLGNFASPSLGGFDIDVTFDDSILSFNSETFGTLLGASIQDVDTSTPGVVNLFEVSLESVSTLDGIQPDSFLLATLMFDGIALGASQLGFGFVLLSDAIGDVIPNPTLVPASVTVVPLPASIWLFVTGLLGLTGISRTKRSV